MSRLNRMFTPSERAIWNLPVEGECVPAIVKETGLTIRLEVEIARRKILIDIDAKELMKIGGQNG